MKRNIELSLLNWKNSKNHLPLLLQGARQVGKSFIVENWGKNYFENVVIINFELYPEYIKCFNSLEPNEILKAIMALSKQKIVATKTLLFLDEIQECPNAIQALRYFKEKCPQLHVIGAGSLLEFILNDAKFRMPVGRIQFMYLKPMSFQEYLFNAGYEDLQKYIQNATIESGIPEPVHLKLLKLVKEYFVIGGMPAAVQEYLVTQNFMNVQTIQTNLLNTYRLDFGKYASRAEHKYLRQLFAKAPSLIAQHFKFSKVDPDIRAREFKSSLEMLCYAGLIAPVSMTAATGLPLDSLKNDKKFKLLFLDIGLVSRTSQLEAEVMLNEDIFLVNRGALAEQFVGQELRAYVPFTEEAQLYFWCREKPSSTAEVDYIISIGQNIIPLEVKAGTTGQLKSLKIFMVEKKSKLGIHISQSSLQFENALLSLPIYMISELPRLVKLCGSVAKNGSF